jgi:hypothetical protein
MVKDGYFAGTTTLVVGISGREEERHGFAVHRPKRLGAASAAA